MAFDLGFNFRETLGFVTDQAYAKFAPWASNYPVTVTNANGDSIDAGWDAPGSYGAANNNAGNDPRLAGDQYTNNVGNQQTFRVDLASGSAPGAGTYLVDVAVWANSVVAWRLYDDTTLVIDQSNGGAGYSVAGGDFRDATGTHITASTNWTGTQVSQVFATTTVKLVLGYTGLNAYSHLSHFRLALATGASMKAAIWARNANTLLGSGRVA